MPRPSTPPCHALCSWHHRSFDQEPDIPGVPPASPWTIGDYRCCLWPDSVPGGWRKKGVGGEVVGDHQGKLLSPACTPAHLPPLCTHLPVPSLSSLGTGGDVPGSLELAEWFDNLNDTPAWSEVLAGRGGDGCDVLSFSHFLPHQVRQLALLVATSPPTLHALVTSVLHRRRLCFPRSATSRTPTCPRPSARPRWQPACCASSPTCMPSGVCFVCVFWGRMR